MPVKSQDNCQQQFVCPQGPMIARIESKVEEVLLQNRRLFEILEGNGQPGLKTRLAQLETSVQEHHAVAKDEHKQMSTAKISMIVVGLTFVFGIATQLASLFLKRIMQP